MKKLAFGLMRLPLADKNDYTKIDMDTARRMIDDYLAHGFSYFDTAYVYHGGMSEKLFGELVAARYPRDSFELTTKMPVFMIKSADEDMEWFLEDFELTTVSAEKAYALPEEDEKWKE